MTSQSPPPADTQEKQAASSAGVMSALRAKVIIETLPVTRAFRRQKRLVEDRGELALIEDGLTIHHLGYFSLLPEKGFRGGHAHGRKTEHFYVVSGILLLELVDTDTGFGAEVRLKAGNKVVVRPGIAHRFAAEETAQVIEYYEGTYEKDDDLPFGFGEGSLPRIDAGVLGDEACR
jgi:mannose-6-phosphate isomerase-like protein (cupin superfamily)